MSPAIGRSSCLRIRRCGVVRDRDHVVRWGGEEFALLLPGANAERAAEVVGRLRAALAQAHLLSGTPVFTASFGISDSTMTRDRETLIRIADEALYRSKQAGRDCCTVGDPQVLSIPGVRRERDQGAVVDITQVARAAVEMRGHCLDLQQRRPTLWLGIVARSRERRMHSCFAADALSPFLLSRKHRGTVPI